MDTLRLKPSRIRRLREIENLVREAKEIYDEFEEHHRARNRVARKARKLANKVRKQYPDMKLVEDPDGPGLHEQLESLAKVLHVPSSREEEAADEPLLRAKSKFDGLFSFLARLGTVPWLDPLG